MRDEDKTREQLLEELTQLRQRLTEFEALEEEGRLLKAELPRISVRNHTKASTQQLIRAYSFELRVALTNMIMYSNFLHIASDEKKPIVARRLDLIVSVLRGLIDDFASMQWLDWTEEE